MKASIEELAEIKRHISTLTFSKDVLFYLHEEVKRKKISYVQLARFMDWWKDQDEKNWEQKTLDHLSK